MRTFDLCYECGGQINRAGYCESCGLSASDFQDRKFTQGVIAGAREIGAEESRQRKIRRVRSYGSGKGYRCILCTEMFGNLREDSLVEGDSKMLGVEQPGSNFARFVLKQELEEHIEMVHGGRRAYWKKVSDAKRMAIVRRLKYEESVNSLRDSDSGLPN